jgi:mitogen-activated protein kinase kinase kinase 11
MRFLHAHKPLPILHGDLKTSNLLVSDDFKHIALSDFGLSARLVSATGVAGPGGGLTISISPPEVLINPTAPRGPAVDVYAFAIVMLEMVTGQAAYRGMRRHEVEQVVLRGDRPPIPENVPLAVQDLIQQCWAQSPVRRPSFAQVVDWLEELMRDMCPVTTRGGLDETIVGNTTTTTAWRSGW